MSKETEKLLDTLQQLKPQEQKEAITAATAYLDGFKAGLESSKPA